MSVESSKPYCQDSASSQINFSIHFIFSIPHTVDSLFIGRVARSCDVAMSVTTPEYLTSKRKSPPTSALESDPYTTPAGPSKRPRRSRFYSTEGHAARASIEPISTDRIYEDDIYNIVFGAKDGDRDPLKSDEDAPGTNLSLQIGGGKRSDQEDDSEEDEWETEEDEEEEELETDEDMFAGITREVMMKSLGELFSSGFLQREERDCKPRYRGQGMKRLRELFVQRPREDGEGAGPLNLLQEEDWRDLEAIFRETRI